MTKPIKILYAASTKSHLDRFHRPYIQSLKKYGEVALMATGEDVDFPILFDKHFFSISNLKSIQKIRKILKEESFDLILVHTTLAAFLIRMALKGLKKRPYVINVVHGYLFQEDLQGLKAKILLLCEKLVRKQTDDIVVMNQEDWRIANKHGLCQRRVFGVSGMGIPDAFSTPAPDAELRGRFISSEGDCLCTFVGELSNRKNQAFLIQAVKRLREKRMPVRLCLVGDGENKERLEEEIRTLGLQDSVFLAGSTSCVGDYLAITDIYVSASISEGLPFNIMEAMAYGLPIVASDVKGQSDLLEGVPQGLYPLNDMEAFCQSVAEICNSRRWGVHSVEYPNLAQDRLSAVFGSVMRIYMRGVKANDADN